MLVLTDRYLRKYKNTTFVHISQVSHFFEGAPFFFCQPPECDSFFRKPISIVLCLSLLYQTLTKPSIHVAGDSEFVVYRKTITRYDVTLIYAAYSTRSKLKYKWLSQTKGSQNTFC